jgi:hypothetical protein
MDNVVTHFDIGVFISCFLKVVVAALCIALGF